MDRRRSRDRSKRLWQALAAAASVHAILVAAVLSLAPRPRVADEEPLPVELRDVAQAPPPPSVGPPLPPPRPSVGPPRAMGPSRSPARRAATQSTARSTTPAPGGTPQSPAAPSLLSMREAPDLRLRAPLPPERPRDELGLPSNPVPNVIHHPVGPPPLAGTHRDPSGLETTIGADGSIRFRDPASVRDVHGTVGSQGLPGVGGKLDFNDTIERWAGNDPYAYQKRKIAEATFEERLCLAREDARRRGQEALFHLKDRLERVLQVPGLGLLEQRRTIFELWDECLDGKGDDAQLGAAARATIVAFIKRAFPPGTARAYPAAELTALNARRSSDIRFDPYGGQSGGGVRPL